LIAPEEKVFGDESALSECYSSCTVLGPRSHRLVWTKAKGREQVCWPATSLLLWLGLFIF